MRRLKLYKFTTGHDEFSHHEVIVLATSPEHAKDIIFKDQKRLYTSKRKDVEAEYGDPRECPLKTGIV